MIVDITGIELIPGNGGADCPGNGERGECCCDECDDMICCFGVETETICESCRDRNCPRWLENE